MGKQSSVPHTPRNPPLTRQSSSVLRSPVDKGHDERPPPGVPIAGLLCLTTRRSFVGRFGESEENDPFVDREEGKSFSTTTT
jgi:hypothetical protein